MTSMTPHLSAIVEKTEKSVILTLMWKGVGLKETRTEMLIISQEVCWDWHTNRLARSGEAAIGQPLHPLLDDLGKIFGTEVSAEAAVPVKSSDGFVLGYQSPGWTARITILATERDQLDMARDVLEKAALNFTY